MHPGTADCAAVHYQRTATSFVRCVGKWPSARHRHDDDHDYNLSWDEDMQANVDAMNAALEPDDA
jgi:hypothetical protein